MSGCFNILGSEELGFCWSLCSTGVHRITKGLGLLIVLNYYSSGPCLEFPKG